MPQTIDYATKYNGFVDERFKESAKSNGVVNQNFDWTGAKTVAVYDISTSAMNDYARVGAIPSASRYGTIEDLNAIKQEMTLTKDRSFTFVIDKMQADETANALNAGTALARQLREKVIPEIDKYRFDKMATLAGDSATSVISKTTIYNDILAGTEALDDAEVPVDGRQLIVTPAIFKLMKESSDIIMETEIGMEARERGVVAMIDGMEVLKVPSSRFGTANFGFMIAHPVATVAPVKLAEYRTHQDPPGVSGTLVEGRIYYDAFVLNNKADAIYVHINTTP
ncbi:MAG: hypothetical protein LC100_06130 [Chitinophagales bacterium]|nr:hypothetical protein [Chitinophagales bacterium]